MDSNLDSLQSMLTSHGFSVDTSALLDVSAAPRRAQPCSRPSLTGFPPLQLFSPSVTVPEVNLPDLDSSLASVRTVGWGVGEKG